MTPGATKRPSASMVVVAAAPLSRPMSAILPSVTPTSAR